MPSVWRRAACVDDEVAVPGGDLRAANLEAAKTQFFDDLSRRFAEIAVVFEDGTRRRVAEMAFCFAFRPAGGGFFGNEGGGAGGARIKGKYGFEDDVVPALKGAFLVSKGGGVYGGGCQFEVFVEADGFNEET